MNSNPQKGEREPICFSIESLLRDLETHGEGRLESSQSDDRVGLSFGGVRVEGETYDIALLRLANAMMDHPRYCPALIAMLRKPVQVAQ